MELIEMHDGGPQVIKLRLSSSRAGGPYYYVWPEEEYRTERPWGFNRSPYEPLFRVEAKKYYRIKMINELKRELIVHWQYFPGDQSQYSQYSQYPVIYPESRREEVLSFLQSFEDPFVLVVGWCTWAGFEAGLHRISELIIIDRTTAVDLYAQREKLFNEVRSLLVSTPYAIYTQGNLRVELYPPIPSQKLPSLSNEASASLFNHAFSFTQHPLWSIALDNQRMFAVKGDTEIHIYSYDHETMSIRIVDDSVILFTHPFPSARGVD